MIFLTLAIILDNSIGLTAGELPYGVFYFLYSLAFFIPALAVTARRLHDIGKSGWMILIGLIPLIGGIWLLVLSITDSDPEENQYGGNPKDVQIDDTISTKTRDLIILLVVVWMFFNRAFWTILPKVINDFYSTVSFEIISKFMNLFWAVIPISLAFTVKNKSKQILLIILGSIYLINELFEVLSRS
jgi:hypothetical protein